MVQPRAFPASRGGAHERRRLEILRRAAEVFRERGYHRAGMREIADRLGVQPGALYHYFRSKDDLLLACQSMSLDRLVEGARRIAATPRPAADRLRALVALHLEQTLDVTGGGAAHVEVGALPARCRRALVRRRDAYEREVRQVIAAGVADGTFRDLDPKLAALTLLGALNWTAVWWRPDGAWSAGGVAAGVADLLLAGLERRGGRGNDQGPGGDAKEAGR